MKFLSHGYKVLKLWFVFRMGLLKNISVSKSATRFGEILPLWQNMFSIWQFFDITFGIVFNLLCAKKLCHWANVHCCNWPKHYRAIWSHWYWNITLWNNWRRRLDDSGRSKHSRKWSGDSFEKYFFGARRTLYLKFRKLIFDFFGRMKLFNFLKKLKLNFFSF